MFNCPQILSSDVFVIIVCIMLAVSGKTLRVDMTYKGVKRDTTGRTPEESNITQSTAKVKHLYKHAYTDRHTLCQRLLIWLTQRLSPLNQLSSITTLWA